MHSRSLYSFWQIEHEINRISRRKSGEWKRERRQKQSMENLRLEVTWYTKYRQGARKNNTTPYTTVGRQCAPNHFTCAIKINTGQLKYISVFGESLGLGAHCLLRRFFLFTSFMLNNVSVHTKMLCGVAVVAAAVDGGDVVGCWYCCCCYFNYYYGWKFCINCRARRIIHRPAECIQKYHEKP